MKNNQCTPLLHVSTEVASVPISKPVNNTPDDVIILEDNSDDDVIYLRNVTSRWDMSEQIRWTRNLPSSADVVDQNDSLTQLIVRSDAIEKRMTFLEATLRTLRSLAPKRTTTTTKATRPVASCESGASSRRNSASTERQDVRYIIPESHQSQLELRVEQPAHQSAHQPAHQKQQSEQQYQPSPQRNEELEVVFESEQQDWHQRESRWQQEQSDGSHWKSSDPRCCASSNRPPSRRGAEASFPQQNERVYVEVPDSAVGWKRGRVERRIIEPNQPEKFEVKVDSADSVVVFSRNLAYWKAPRNAELSRNSHVIARPDRAPEGEHDVYLSGKILELPREENKYRYLIFFDCEEAHYVSLSCIRAICDSSVDVTDDNYNQSFLDKNHNHPELNIELGEKVITRLGGAWRKAVVVEVDCSIVKIKCKDMTGWFLRTDSFIRKRRKSFKQPDVSQDRKTSISSTATNGTTHSNVTANSNFGINTADERRNHLKSDSHPGRTVPENQSTRTVQIRDIRLPDDVPRPKKLRPHKCGPSCISWVPARPQNEQIVCEEAEHLKEFICWNPLAIPLFHGWRRKVEKGVVIYITPCGRVYRKMEDIFQYLRVVKSELTIDLFDANVEIRPLARLIVDESLILMSMEGLLEKTCSQRRDSIPVIPSLSNTLVSIIQQQAIQEGQYCLIYKHAFKLDLSNGKEKVPISVFNDIDRTLPAKFRYWHTYAQPAPSDPKFLPTCQCDDGCRSKCSCYVITLTEMEKINTTTMHGTIKFAYEYRRLYEKIDTGVFECNACCQCTATCLNRLAQNPLMVELQVFKTLEKGWGVRSIYDIPVGSFICTYSGDVLTNENAEREGCANGDMYFVELDHRELAEKATRKEGYESQVEEDFDDFEIPSLPVSRSDNELINKRALEERAGSAKRRKESFLTESSVGSVLNAPGPSKSQNPYASRDNYVVNGMYKGNISRFFNHSCDPNMFVQNVFVDTHDLLLPRVALFASKHILAGSELTWDYGYESNSLPGKYLKCNCKSSKCDGRLL